MRDCAGEHCRTGRIDLNADLGEGFGVWRLGDDDALLGIVTSANVACGFHAGDPSTMRRVCTRAAARGGRRRRPGVLPRPGRVRPPLHRRRAGRAGRRRALPTRRARRDRPRRRRPGVLRQAARCALQRRGRTTRGRRGRSSRPSLAFDRRAAGARAARLGAAARGGGGGHAPGRRGVRRPRLHRRRHARAPRREPGALVQRPGGGGRAGGADGGRRRRRRGGRHDAARCPSSRSACTATPRARSSWPGGAGGAGGRRPHARPRSPADRSARRSVGRADRPARSRPESRSAATSSTVRPPP